LSMPAARNTYGCHVDGRSIAGRCPHTLDLPAYALVRTTLHVDCSPNPNGGGVSDQDEPESTNPADEVATASSESAVVPVAAAVPAQPIQRFRPMPMPSMPFWIVLIASVVGFFIILAAWTTVVIFAIAVSLSLVLLPIVNWLERRGWNRTAAAGLIVLLIVVIVVLILLGITAIIVNQGVPFLQALPGYVAQLQANVAGSTLPDALKSTLESILTGISTALASVDPDTLIAGFFSTAISVVLTLLSLLVVPFFMLYFMRDQPSIATGFYKSLPPQWHIHVTTAIGFLKNDFANYFKAEIIVGSIVAVMVTIGCLVIGFIVGGPIGEFAFLLGLIAGLFEFLPTIGPILALIPAVLLALTTSPLAVALVLIFYFIVFNIEGSILVPLIEGKVVSFRAATVLFLVMLGFALGGLIGAILALPVGAIVRDLYTYFWNNATKESLTTDTA
jgi:predicted PurR-regulated permease PerM